MSTYVDPIIEKQVNPYFEKIRNGDEKSVETLKMLAQHGRPAFKEYISTLAESGNEIAKDIIDQLTEEEVAQAIETAANPVEPEEEEPKKKLNIKQIKLHKSAVPISNLKLDWGYGPEDMYFLLKVPCNNSPKQQREVWVKELYCCGAAVLPEVEVDLPGYKDGDDYIEDDGEGNTVYHGKFNAKFSELERDDELALGNFRKLWLNNQDITSDQAVLIRNVGKDEEKANIVETSFIVSRGKEKYPYKVNSFAGDEVGKCSFRLVTDTNEEFFLIKWNLGEFKGSIV